MALHYSLSVDIDGIDDIKTFLKWLSFQCARLQCKEDEILTKLAQEWDNDMKAWEEMKNESSDGATKEKLKDKKEKSSKSKVQN
jgi:hypothetical protein